MPEPSTSVFGRRPSLFSGKKRKESAAPVSPPVSEELSPRDRRDRQSSIVSLPASVNESNLQRSVSLASNDSVSSLSRHKSRAPSVANISSHSPIRLHRVSRSISANAAHTVHKFGSFSSTISPQQSHESISQSPHTRSRDQGSISALDPPPKTPFAMLATPFGHGIKRQDTGMTYTSKPSISSESGSAAMAASLAGASSPVIIFHNISEISNKRIATLEYLRKVHEGQVYYFNTLQYSPANLQNMSSLLPSKIGRRATNYLLLGTSIPPLLDCNTGSPLEYLGALYSVLAEFDTFQSSEGSVSGTRGRMGQMFKSGMRMRTGRRSSAAQESLYSMDTDHNASTTALDAMAPPPMSSYSNHQEFTYLQTPSLPFEPDFATTYATLTDVLIDTYTNFLQLLPGPEACTPTLSEAFMKADKMIRKILVQNVVQEFGETTRKEVKSEVAGLGKVVLSGLM